VSKVHEHHNFFFASQHPNLKEAPKKVACVQMSSIAQKYNRYVEVDEDPRMKDASVCAS
jgi:hypothetical protein